MILLYVLIIYSISFNAFATIEGSASRFGTMIWNEDHWGDTRVFKLGEQIPLSNKLGENLEWDDIDWTKTTFSSQSHVIKIDHAKKLLAGDIGQFTINWTLMTGEQYSQEYEADSTPVDDDYKIIYENYQTKAPQVDLNNISEITIHYNKLVYQKPADQTDLDPNLIYVWMDNKKLFAKVPQNFEKNAYVILEYNNNNPDSEEDHYGIEIVQIKEYERDADSDSQNGHFVDVGSRLFPEDTQYEDIYAEVLTGKSGESKLIYQHDCQNSPQYKHVWAIGKNLFASNMEIIWMRKGLRGVAWPFEYRQYTSDWPATKPEKYQLYVRGDSRNLGPEVRIPDELNPEIAQEQFISPYYAELTKSPSNFFATGPGWVLLKYMTGPSSEPGRLWVGFEVVRCVLRTDFDLTPIDWDIGKEIVDTYHQGVPPEYRPGYIHIIEGYRRYAPAIYDVASGGTGQIFAVNTDVLEVWWYNLSRIQDPEGSNWPDWPGNLRVQWPSKVVRYNAVWPENPKKIIIARQNGTGVIKKSIYGEDWEIYYENDSNKHGFNPNEEHAIKRQYSTGSAIFPLRNDLNTPEISEPYVLMKYKVQLENARWNFEVYKVLDQEAPYLFQDWAHLSNNSEDPNFDPSHDPALDPYEGYAGLLIQAPFPLSILQYCEENKGISGPFFEDRTGRHWAKAAGVNDSAATITMQYHYPVQPGFYFPDGSHKLGDHVPLSDNKGNPVNVIYTINWPDAPQMKINQTIIESEAGLPNIAGQSSVDIIYQQSVEKGDGPSVILIDPVRMREVALDTIPEGIKTEIKGAEKIFPDLSLALRNRITYDPVNFKLKLKGKIVEPKNGFALLNVMSEREKTELLELSKVDYWQTAVRALYDASKNPEIIDNSDEDLFDALALTSGYAQGTGYVTLVMQNKKGLDPLPISLEIIKVIPELNPGSITDILPQCPFDETLTLRHKADFGGRTDDFEFEWRYLIDGSPLDENKDNWSYFTPKPENGKGAIDITIKGAGLLTLSDNRFVCRYKYIGSDMPVSIQNQWTEWTEHKHAPGWIKRAIGDIDPFTQKASGGGIQGAEDSFFSYDDKEVDTVVSMISQAGPMWEGSVPMNCLNLDNFGLIEIYETIFNRGKDLSINGLPPVNFPPANSALLLVTSRISDLYMLLGNESYADASDPTIAFGTDDGQYGSEASSIHCFMNQTSSLLEEELALLRGRDDSASPDVHESPVYNRLYWNFTQDITGGELAYALNYNIQDENGDAAGHINEADAQKNYPQGHGDAWGHYLSAIKNYYSLLTHPNYDWNVRSEHVSLGTQDIEVDYLDERKFANAAASKARVGAEIVNMTYRLRYVENPDGQWQGYKDTDTDQAWGFSEWASRAGLGAYIDWVVGNAILPAKDENPDHSGIQKIDRTTVLELRDIANRFVEIQSQVDSADLGLNPLGLANNVVPFDISPDKIKQGQTHFEQIYDRAVTAMNNAITVFNHANNATQLLRRQADSLAKFKETVEDKEADFKNRLIEVFGYPYPDDIGVPGYYPADYDGPDIYHYMYIDPSELLGKTESSVQAFKLTMTELKVQDDGSLLETIKIIDYHMSTSANRFGLIKPSTWTGERRAPGELQMARSDLIQARARFERALQEYDNLILDIEDQAEQLKAQYNMNAEEIDILNKQLKEQKTLHSQIAQSRERQLSFRKKGRIATLTANALAEFMPKMVIGGLAIGGDMTSGIRGAIRQAGTAVAEIMNQLADRESIAELDHQQAMQEMQAQTNITLTTKRGEYAIAQQIKQLEQAVRREISQRIELLTMQEAMQQSSGRYMAVLARGQRLLEDRTRFRRQTASNIQSRRYKDMAFRIFRNDALQKYRAQFDMAARYVYLAAKAYDFGTTLLSNDSKAGEAFLSNIVKKRLIGTIEGGIPETGMGLADPMKTMSQNFQVMKDQMGFTNPQKETNRFSLRTECFRIQSGFAGNALWRECLRQHVVPNLLDMTEFIRYARLFDPANEIEPGIVIPFESNINFGMNFFGWPLGGGDSAYDSSHFTTKVRSVGVWFSNYNNLSMSDTPRVYLIPVGSDIQRSPTGGAGNLRIFKILDQKLPTPFQIGSASVAGDWLPLRDSQDGSFVEIRKYSSFRAYHDGGQFDENEVHRDSRLIGRSVWNTKWLLIIPAGTLLNDRIKGLNRFIDGMLVGEQRDGNGVSDIKIIFETYAFSGNK